MNTIIIIVEKRVNIGITGQNKSFQYLIELKTNDSAQLMNGLNYLVKDDQIYFGIHGSENALMRSGNVWNKMPELNQTQFLPEDLIIKTAKLTLYFPQYSIDVYERGVEYTLSINTWLNGKCIWLGSYLLHRSDAIACSNIRNDSQSYYEKISIDIINPYDLLYADEWARWRQNICGTIEDIFDYGSILCCTLYPVSQYQNYYIVDDKWQGSQSSINIANNIDDYFKLNLIYDSQIAGFIATTNPNSYLKNSLSNYMSKIYDMDFDDIRYELVIRDKNDIYKYLYANDITSFHVFDYKDLNLTSWDEWKEGIFVQSSITWIKNKQDTFTLLSNEIPLTQEIYSRLLGCNTIEETIEDLNGNVKLNLDEIDMKIINLNVVNKIQNNIVQVENPKNSKSGIIQPVFFRVRELQNLIIHPEITENISINLDAYKSKVNTFLIQIEGTIFQECGRTGNGILFKIIGSSLPKSVEAGKYYILNENQEIVTMGNYQYEY